jgi:hypothetical protein
MVCAIEEIPAGTIFRQNRTTSLTSIDNGKCSI